MSAPPPRSLLPVFIGIALTAVLLAGLAYLSSVRRNARPIAPTLTILQPAPGAAVDSPLVVQFTSSAPLVLTPSGWTSGTWHLHARVNQLEYMPAAAEITTLDSSYQWVLPAVPRGAASIKLGWADQRHRETSIGSSDVVRTTIR
jgi:hypothetical protein